MTLVYVGLGSNLQDPITLQDPVTQVERAFGELHEITQTQVTGRSPLYSSRALGPIQPDYINAVAQLETTLDPLALLDALQAIEQRHNRLRKERWGPRTLDLDLLLYGDQIIRHKRLCVPHPELSSRNFVLYPLADLNPDLYLPEGIRLIDLLNQTSTEGLVRLDVTQPPSP
jgi:2-amino-4-hydroxy-6-hydroxymethyldihydropteridine diphosphokinase